MTSTLNVTGVVSTTSTVNINGDLKISGNIYQGGSLILDATPVGALMPYAGITTPSGWLFCSGQAISRSTYSELFVALSTTYGIGDGATTFNLPNLCGRVVVGTGQGSGLTNRNLASSGGAETHTLTTAEMPSHSHTGTSDSGGSHSHTITDRFIKVDIS